MLVEKANWIRAGRYAALWRLVVLVLVLAVGLRFALLLKGLATDADLQASTLR